MDKHSPCQKNVHFDFNIKLRIDGGGKMKKVLYYLSVITLAFVMLPGIASADQCEDGSCVGPEFTDCFDFGVLNICECEPLTANDIVIYFEEAVEQKLIKGFVSKAFKRTHSRQAIRKAKRAAIREMRALLETASNLETNHPAAACSVLSAALDRCDRDKVIQDYVRGPAKDGLACRIDFVLGSVCE
jgi:hypothetical protein